MASQLIGLDGDDTLWHSEGHFVVTQARYGELLDPWVDRETVAGALLDAERRNLRLFGYGVKGFTLSMIETAIELTNGDIDGDRIHQIVQFGKELLDHPVELLPGVAETLEQLRHHFRLALITKGDLFHQESKIAASGLADIFERVEVLAEKDETAYAKVLDTLGVAPPSFCMVGNSMRSDIAPVLEIGGVGVHVPYHITWELEHVEEDIDDPRMQRVESILDVPIAIEALFGRTRQPSVTTLDPGDS